MNTASRSARDVVWTARAKRDLDTIRVEIANDAPIAPARFVARLVAAGESLEAFAERFRASGQARELATVRPYVIRYRVEPEAIVILGVRHGARRRTP
jgi:plasmid stabilization system protein ParE